MGGSGLVDATDVGARGSLGWELRAALGRGWEQPQEGAVAVVASSAVWCMERTPWLGISSRSRWVSAEFHVTGSEAGTDSGKAKTRAVSSLQRTGLQFPVPELKGNESKDLKAKCITLHDLQLVICGNEELDSVIQATIAGCGVILHVHKSLIRKKGQQKTP
ncbi:histone H2A.Z-like [Carlito syrichta]|uniref:Histone H2A.Z-like n=1 Tax=Carlito syrichta TaxID=1868482 RepID=A0A3Q0DSU0_CARSF|nr:histone H2A.Z-like [Carlito syrichta]